MATQKLRKADCIAAVKAVRSAGGVQAAADKAGIPRTTMRDRYREGIRLLAKSGEEAPEPNHEEEAQILRERVRSLETMLRTNNRDTLSAEYIKKQIIKLADTPVTPPNWVLAPVKKGEPGVPVTMWSDWHLGETVRSEEVNGVNEYNLSVAHARVQRLVGGTIDMLTNYTVHTKPYPGIVVCLGGDMVSGDIHEELRETNERPTMAVVVEAVGILRWAIATLADRFGRVFVPCVAGNHGRTSGKPKHANRNWTNFDWLIYQFLAKSFEGDSRVHFLIGEGADVIFSVFGHRYLLTHGDNLAKGGDGQIGHFGPVIRGSQRRQVRNQAVNQEFDTMICGHYHSLTMTPRFIVNGSLVGPGAFSHNLAFSFEKPQQALWMSHQNKGVTICMPVFLEDGSPYKGEAPDWVSWSTRQ